MSSLSDAFLQKTAVLASMVSLSVSSYTCFYLYKGFQNEASPNRKIYFLNFFVMEKEFRENYTALILPCKSSSLPDYFYLGAVC